MCGLEDGVERFRNGDPVIKMQKGKGAQRHMSRDQWDHTAGVLCEWFVGVRCEVDGIGDWGPNERR